MSVRDLKRKDRFVGKGMDPVELARAEGHLQNTADAELSKEWIESTVARVTGAAPRRFRLLRRTSLAAAVLLASFFMLAGVRVLWPARQNSSTTMSFAEAVEILGQTDLAGEPQKAALGEVSGRVTYIVDTLNKVQAASDPELSPLAEQHLQTLRQIVATGQPRPGRTVDEGLAKAGRDVQDDNQPMERRRLLLDYLAASGCSGVSAMLQMADKTPGLMLDRDREIRRLKRQFVPPIRP